MGRQRKSTEDEWYDVFASWPLADQKIALRVLERLVIERERDEKRAARAGKTEAAEPEAEPSGE